MVRDSDKYRTTMFQIAGFGLMSPLSMVVMNLYSYLSFEYFNWKLLFCLSIDLILFYFGMIFVLRGLEILKEEEEIWIKKRYMH